MPTTPIASTEQALLLMINAAHRSRQTLESVLADTGIELEEDDADAMDKQKLDEEAAKAHLDTVAPKCPGCREAYAFQRQPKRPTHCSWCGYDHDTGTMPQLVPA